MSRFFSQEEESMRKIRKLGSLPSDAFDKYQGLTLSQVGSLEGCNKSLFLNQCHGLWYTHVA